MNPSPGVVREPKGQEGPIPSGTVKLAGELIVPTGAKGIVLFAHGSGSSRHSPRNQQVARILRKAGLATLLFDLLTAEEEEQDMKTRHLRFDIERLAGRVLDATTSIIGRPGSSHLRVGYFGSSPGAAAPLLTPAHPEGKMGALVP